MSPWLGSLLGHLELFPLWECLWRGSGFPVERWLRHVGSWGQHASRGSPNIVDCSVKGLCCCGGVIIATIGWLHWMLQCCGICVLCVKHLEVEWMLPGSAGPALHPAVLTLGSCPGSAHFCGHSNSDHIAWLELWMGSAVGTQVKVIPSRM